MYGKLRIKIEKTGSIILAGNKSYIPIGLFKHLDNTIVGRLRNIESWDISLNNENSKEFKFADITELRKYVIEAYKERLTV